MKIIKNLLVLLLTAVICLCLGYFICYQNTNKHTEITPEPVVVDTEPKVIYIPAKKVVTKITVEQIEIKLAEIGELSTYSGDYNVSLSAEETRQIFEKFKLPWTTNRIDMNCEGVVKVGYQINEINPTVDNDSMKIYISLPEPQVLDNYVIWDKVVCEEDNNILNPIDFSQYQLLITEIEKIGLQQTLNQNIYQQAEDHMKTLISNFLAGFDDYEIVFND